MCGIGALVSISRLVSPEWAREMAQVVAHRGPDGEGFAAVEGDDLRVRPFGGPGTPAQCMTGALPYLPRLVANEDDSGVRAILLHRRLSIVDLSPSGHQPMCYDDQRYWIAYNGEVYNHVELRGELESLGHQFVSHSDTEVLLASYAQWGVDCLARFNGMFAFVIIDRIDKKVFAARDRFGVKPLYYWISERGFMAIGSEIKQFTVLPGWSARLEPQLGHDYLVWGLADHTDGTLFTGVFQLRGGQYAFLDLDQMGGFEAGRRIPVSTWYLLPTESFKGSFEQASDEFRGLLSDAVRLRLRADVPVGSCLSGGLDSSSIVCLMRELLGESRVGSQQNTFTAHAATGRLDEKPYADEVVRATSVKPHYVIPSAVDLFGSLGQIAWHQDEPFGSTSIFIQWKVFELAAATKTKVMLDGQGADEVLCGYPVFWGARLAGLFREGRIATLVAEIGALRRMQGRSIWESVKQLGASLLPGSAIEAIRRVTRPADMTWLNQSRLLAATTDPFIRAVGSFRRSVDALSRAQLLRINLPLLLHWEDRNSMAHGVEARVPFLDYRLVELGLALPDAYKLQGGWTKRILRDSMRMIVPAAIRQRREKIGFEAPELDWMRADAQTFRAALERAATASNGIISREGALRLFDRMVAGTIPYSPQPWRLISFGAWAERFAVDCSVSQKEFG